MVGCYHFSNKCWFHRRKGVLDGQDPQEAALDSWSAWLVCHCRAWGWWWVMEVAVDTGHGMLCYRDKVVARGSTEHPGQRVQSISLLDCKSQMHQPKTTLYLMGALFETIFSRTNMHVSFLDANTEVLPACFLSMSFNDVWTGGDVGCSAKASPCRTWSNYPTQDGNSQREFWCGLVQPELRSWLSNSTNCTHPSQRVILAFGANHSLRNTLEKWPESDERC